MLPQTVTVYRITCTHAYDLRDTGTRFSLDPWPGNDLWNRGRDDGGTPYGLPYGFTVVNDPRPFIVDRHGDPCPLTTYGGLPAIITRDARTLTLQEL